MDQNQEFPIKGVISRMNKDATIQGKQCFKSLMGNQPMAPWLTVHNSNKPMGKRQSWGWSLSLVLIKSTSSQGNNRASCPQESGQTKRPDYLNVQDRHILSLALPHIAPWHLHHMIYTGNYLWSTWNWCFPSINKTSTGINIWQRQLWW